MALRNIVTVGDSVLSKKCRPVTQFDKRLHTLIEDMMDTLEDSNGVGLAAPQVGVSKRIIVIDAEQYEEDGEYKRGNPMCLVNPEIINKSEEMILFCEGCLSVPKQSADVERHYAVKVRYLDYNGKEQEIEAEDYLAVVLQHEIDHLDGILYIDRISRLKRNMLLKKLEKYRQGVK